MTNANISCFLIVAVATASLLDSAYAQVSSTPLRSQPGTPERQLLESLPVDVTGVDFQNTLRSRNIRKYLTNGAGLSVGDFDSNGLPDIFLVSQDGENALFSQVEPWKFENVTAAAGIANEEAWGTGASFADIDNDGDLDLYVCNTNAANLLYINQGDGTFIEQAALRGVAHAGATSMASFADYDNDGDLDLYVLNNRIYATAEESPNIQIRMINGVKTVHPDYRDQYFFLDGHLCEAGQRDTLYRNMGDGHFEDVTDEAGIDGYDMGLSATWWDFNDDGHLDLYIANDMMSPDRLYQNDGEGGFTDVLKRTVPHTPWYAMGADFADLNNDGVFDLLVADMANTTHYKQKVMMGNMGAAAWFLKSADPPQYMRNALYLSTGFNRYMEVAYLAGLASTDWTWSVLFADMDLDGLEDMLCTNGVARNMNHSDWAARFEALLAEGNIAEAESLIEQIPALEENNLAFKNKGDLHFDNVSDQWGFNHFGVSQGMVLADLDRDGDLDAVVNNMNELASVYRNKAIESGKNAAVLELVGVESNRQGVGAKITARIGDKKMRRQITLARGYMSGGESLVHFGLGEADVIDQLTIEWPSGTVQTLTDLAANHLHRITETATPQVELAEKPVEESWFVPFRPVSNVPFRHQETPFDDFVRQSLLPNQLSQLGPGLAWGDADGDGDEDLFVGGAAGQAGELLLNEGGRFTPVADGPWVAHTQSEDMGIIWFDADGDDDLDLYVVSGSNECEPGDPVLLDRLYINSGSGSFTHDPNALPSNADSGGPVAAADFDQDGDLDLFVGGRQVPGAWPTIPRSQLLRNDDGRFTDVTDEIAADLTNAGMATGAVWSDTDLDGLIDLVVTYEWGPVRVFKNTADGIIDQTEAAGLEGETGWWNGIASGDIDQDGDIDFIVTNFGHNTKYHASHHEPARLYAGDLDENGSLDLVEAEFEDGTLFPVRGRSCSSNAMPFIADKFPTFDQFGLAELDEIYDDDRLASSQQLEARLLECVVLINDGKGRFEIQALPHIMQAAPGFGVVLEDFDADGHVDVYIAQNFYTPQIETGRMDGGVSMMARGNGDGSFSPIMPGTSGLMLPFDAKALTVCDLNDDGRPDVLATVNDGPVLGYLNARTDTRYLTVDLRGKSGNAAAAGALVTLETTDGIRQTREVTAGSGYLSQSSAAVRFGIPDVRSGGTVTVRWPDGSISSQTLSSDQNSVSIAQP